MRIRGIKDACGLSARGNGRGCGICRSPVIYHPQSRCEGCNDVLPLLSTISFRQPVRGHGEHSLQQGGFRLKDIP
jgi:hypothetical protein